MGQVSSRISNLFNEKQKETPINECRRQNNSSFLQQVKNFDIADEHISENYDNIEEKIVNSTIFATPRLPLKRTRELSPNTSVLPQSILDIISPCTKKLKMEEEYMDFPFISDSSTKDYLKKCKLMFILRGLPGSGKSTISKSLRRNYISCEICSADDFFMNGLDYQYDGKKIGEAHKFCKQKAVNAVLAQTRTIIIDNTNTKCWEMKFYLDLAKSFNYFPIVVEPKTPWRRDINILVKKNTHNVDEDSLSFKIKNFEELNPLYYGWFINEADSYLLNIEGQSWLEEAFTIDVFQKNLASYSGVNSFEDFVKIYAKTGSSLHVTSKYTAKNLPEDKAYMESNDVKNSIGKIFDLEIIGFIITPRTFGARVKLTAKQEILWAGDDFESIPDQFWNVYAQEDDIKLLNTEDILQDIEANDDELECNEKNIKTLEQNHKNSHEIENKQLHAIDESSYIVNKSGVVNSNTDFPEINNSPTSYSKNVNNELTGNDIFNESLFAVDGIDVENNDKDVIGDIDTTVNQANNPMIKPKNLPNVKKIKHNKIIPLNHSEKQSFKNKCSPNKNKSPKKGDVLIPENKFNPEQSVTEATIEEKPIGIVKNKFNPTCGRGSRAHITLGCQTNIKPVTTGLDLLFAIELENCVLNTMEKTLSELNVSMSDMGVKDATSISIPVNKEFCERGNIKHTLSLNGATAINYGYGVWVIYLEKKLVVSSIFNMNC